MNKKITFIILILLFSAFITQCSDDETKKYSDPLHQALMGQGEPYKLVTFTIAGNVACKGCSDAKLEVLMVELELYSPDDPTNTISLKILNNLGPFEFKDVRYEKDKRLAISTVVRFKGDAPALRSMSIDLTSPSEDNEILSPVINIQYP